MKGKSAAPRVIRTVRSWATESKPKAKTFALLIIAEVSENSIIRDVRNAIKREVSLGGETNFRWVPSNPPMALRTQQWKATGSAIVHSLQDKYPKLVVKQQEITAHYKKELTVFREFLTVRIKKS